MNKRILYLLCIGLSYNCMAMLNDNDHADVEQLIRGSNLPDATKQHHLNHTATRTEDSAIHALQAIYHNNRKDYADAEERQLIASEKKLNSARMQKNLLASSILGGVCGMGCFTSYLCYSQNISKWIPIGWFSATAALGTLFYKKSYFDHNKNVNLLCGALTCGSIVALGIMGTMAPSSNKIQTLLKA